MQLLFTLKRKPNPYLSRTFPRQNSYQKIYRTTFRLSILTQIGVVFRQAGINPRAHNLRRFALVVRANQDLEYISCHPSVGGSIRASNTNGRKRQVEPDISSFELLHFVV